MKTNRGFTLVEMLVTLVLVVLVIMVTASAFESILKFSGRLASSVESNIEGVVGLEIFRHDMQQTGFGLPDSFQSIPPVYTEATVAPASLLNDAQPGGLPGNVPRAIVSLDSGMLSDYTINQGYNILPDTDYLAIKATTVGANAASQKWTYVTYASGGQAPNIWGNAADNFKSDDRVIVLNRTYADTGGVSNKLVYDINAPSSYWPANPTVNMADTFNPLNSNEVYYLYGIETDGTNLSMPFNRADYFVARPSAGKSVPTTCAPNTGILYKANINHNGGGLSYMPLLDCVANMQVVFGWDLGTGVIDESGAYNTDASKISLSSAIGTTPNDIKAIMESPDEIRNKLKYIKVYVMAQDGRRDNSYKNTASITVGDMGVLTKVYSVNDLTAKDWLNYRWKIYRMIIRPKSLNIN